MFVQVHVLMDDLCVRCLCEGVVVWCRIAGDAHGLLTVPRLQTVSF